MDFRKEDYKNQYEQELIYQEIKSNGHTLRGILWFTVAVGFVWFLTAIHFFDVNFRLVSIAFGLTVLLFVPTLLFFQRGDLSQTWVKYFLLAMICIVSGIIISILTVHAVLLHVIPLLYAIQYRKRRVIWYAYAMNLISLFFSCIMGFYYGLCDMNILFASQHVRDWYMNHLENGTLNLSLNENHLFVIIVFEVFPRAIILLIFAILLQYSILSNNEDAVRIANLTYLKEMDIRTGLYNKNKYEEMLANYCPKIENIAVLFWDLNDLKLINDRYGHATGDDTIERFANILNAYSSERCRTYRVGGDEFIMILDSPRTDEAETIMTNAKLKIQYLNESSDFSITGAVGLAYGSGKTLLDVVKKADERMYQNKKFIKERQHP
ncbi:MAG: GGDEF domain-containing protein [Lachnospiraceae bacterium]|nr:GGDEF domain-containing protein [Lachnospiraceae bacterium]